MATVLHIEDDPKNRVLVRKLLTAAGHRVVEAESGLEAIKVAHESPPDIVLVDINIPDLDGYEVILRLRGLPNLSGVPIVAITAEGDRHTSLAVGADGFIEKPIDAGGFGQLVARYLAGYRESDGSQVDGRLREQSQKIVEHLEQKVRELSRANERLEELSRLRREFLQNISHELSTPLTPVIGYLNMLKGGDLGKLSDGQLKAVSAIQSSVERLSSLINTLIDVSAVETNRIEFDEAPYEFAQVVADAVAEAGKWFSEKSIELKWKAPNTQFAGRGDAGKVRRALVHLLDNAAKFTPPHGKVVLCIRDGDVRALGRWYGVVVADSGPGIPKNQISKVLEPFYQVDGSATRSYGGVGLGLAFVRQVAEAHGGSVAVQSPPSEPIEGLQLSGTAVYFRLLANPPQLGPARASTPKLDRE